MILVLNYSFSVLCRNVHRHISLFSKYSLLQSPDFLFVGLVLIIGSIWLPHRMKTLSPDEMREAAAKSGDVTISGTVESIRETDAGFQAVVSGCKCESDSGSIEGFRIRLSHLKTEYEPGTWIVAEGEASEFEPARNDGGFDEAGWMASEDIVCQIPYPEVKESSPPEGMLYTASWQLRQNLKSVFEKTVNADDAGVFLSLMTGDRSELNPDLKSLWQKAGIAHLLAISGLHITFAGSAARTLASAFGAARPVGCAAGAAAAAFFCFFTGNGLSARRALIMYLLFLAAELTGRTYDRISALSLAFILITADRCGAVTSASFILSFSAIGGMAFIYPCFQEKINHCKSRLLRGLLDTAAAGLSAALSMAPAESWLFYEIPLGSFFINLLIIPLSSLLLCSVFLTGISGLLYIPAGKFFAASGSNLLRFFSWLGSASLEIPGSRLITGRPPIYAVILYAVVLMSVCLFLMADSDQFISSGKCAKKRKRLSAALCFAAVILSAVSRGLSLTASKSSVLYMLDVGQGDCLVLQSPDSRVWVIDCGSTSTQEAGSRYLTPFLKFHGIDRIDGLFITHGDTDHINGALQILSGDDFEIGRLFLSDIGNRSDTEEEALSIAESKDVPVSLLAAGDRVRANEYSFAILSPETGEANEDRNEESLVMRYEESGFSVLFMGDAGEVTEKKLLAQGQVTNVDVLKTGHHGSVSASCPEFLTAADPEAALISCGRKNRYGHPAGETLDNLSEAGATYFVTKDTGQITVRHGDGLVVHLQLKESGNGL